MTPRERGGRVLLVDDSAGGAQLMRIAFGERLPDAQLEVYADGERALDDLGANSHIAKPHSLDALFEVVETLGRYWQKVVSLPN